MLCGKEGPRQSGATEQPRGASLAVTILRSAAESVKSDGMPTKHVTSERDSFLLFVSDGLVGSEGESDS